MQNCDLNQQPLVLS